MKQVLLRASVLTQCGYGNHARELARFLLKKHEENKINLQIQALPWGHCPWLIDSTAQNGFIGKLMSLAVNPHSNYDYTFQLQLPNEWDPTLGKINVGLTAAVETDICNPTWGTACDRMSKVIVPSTFTKSVLESTGMQTKCFVVSESFPDEMLNEVVQIPTQLSKIDTNFNFLMIGQLTGTSPETDRKNIFYSIKWFCEAFKDDRDVGLVIKTNSGRNTKIDRNVTINLFKQVLSEVRVGQFPKIHLIHGDLSDVEMNAIYHHPKIKAFVSATRGEGFGLPILEAAVASLPIIATNWSGHLDFLKTGKFIKLDYDLQLVPKSKIDEQIFVSNSKWAEVSERDFKLKLLKFRTSHSIPLEWAKELSQSLRSSHNFEVIRQQYEALFPEL